MLALLNPSISRALLASSTAAFDSEANRTSLLAAPPFTILSFNSRIILCALLRPIPFTDLSALTFSERIASSSSRAVIDDRIILADAAPMPDTLVMSRNSSLSSLDANP